MSFFARFAIWKAREDIGKQKRNVRKVKYRLFLCFPTSWQEDGGKKAEIQKTKQAVSLTKRTIIKLEIYYESLCDHCMQFLSTEVVPTYFDLKDFINITFIPFGNASYTPGEGNKRTSFTCQHGPQECKGNMLQACTLKEITDTTDPGKARELLMVKFVGCVMSSDNPVLAVNKCAKNVGLNDASIKRIAQCESGKLGDQLLAENGDRTHALVPRVRSVPTVVANGKHSDETQENFMSDFRGTLCTMIPVNERPLVCETYLRSKRKK